MTAISDQAPMAGSLEEQARDVVPVVERCTAIVIVGTDPSTAARVALGIAQVEAPRRRVVIVDLAGETPVLQQRLPATAEHGLGDGVRYGVSLDHIAYPTDPTGHVRIVPSGTEPVEPGVLLRSGCWRAMMRTVRHAGSLVLFVAPERLPELEALQRATDGVILLGDARVEDAQRVLAHIELEAPAVMPPAAGDAPGGRETAPLTAARDIARVPRRHIVWLALAAAAVIFTVAYRLARPTPAPRHLAAVVEQDGAFSGGASTASPPAVATAVAPGDVVANPADSSIAAAYAVALVTFNTAPAAQAQLEQSNGQHLPAVTFSHLTVGADSARWYRVSTGAYRVRGSADSLLAALRTRGILGPAAGRVVRAPFAIQMQAHVALSDAHPIASAYRARGIPVYALRQDDGTLTLYAGAFETPAEAEMLLSILRADGEQATVVYRTGRVL